MSLLEELKQRRTAVSAEMDRLEEVGRDVDREWKAQERLFGELYTAITALDPTDPPTAEEMFGDDTDEQPELFEAEQEVASEQLASDHPLPAAADDVVAEEAPEPEFIELDEQTCEPVKERPALNEQMQDERELTAALPQPEWNEPRQSISMIDEQTCEPVDPTLRAFEDDHIVEPQPTEGYAPVTNPEADAIARAHDYYDPKAVADRDRNAGMARLFSYTPFHKPKVDA